MQLKIVPLLFVIINTILCQEFNSSLADPQNVTQITGDSAVIIEPTDNLSSASGSPPAEIAANNPPDIMQEQADQPAQEVNVEPTRAPTHVSSSFPPLVHEQNITSSETPVKMENKTVSEPPVSKETEKTTPSTEEKKPDATAPGGKENDKGAAVVAKENLVLLVASACLFRYLN